MHKVILTLLTVVLLGCGKTMLNAELGTAFNMTSEQKVKINSTDLKLRGYNIIEDSRCPKNVNCIWAGQLVAEFDLNDSPIKLNSLKPLDTLGYRFEIRSVQPEKLKESEKIKKEHYTLEILISK